MISNLYLISFLLFSTPSLFTCPKGSGLHTGEECSLCDRGYYNPSENDYCEPCPPGHACPNTGMNTPNPCERGTYAASLNQIFCDICPEGTYNPDTGKETCLQCNHGEYNNMARQSSCFSCPQNTYNIKMRSTNIDDCLSCKTGYYSVSTTSDVCEPCHKFCTACHGPLASQCDQCSEDIQTIMVATATCACRDYFFYNERQSRCTHCHPYCDKCNGGTNRDCIGCNSRYSYYVETQPTFCISKVYDLQGYYLEGNTWKSSLLFNF